MTRANQLQNPFELWESQRCWVWSSSRCPCPQSRSPSRRRSQISKWLCQSFLLPPICANLFWVTLSFLHKFHTHSKEKKLDNFRVLPKPQKQAMVGPDKAPKSTISIRNFNDQKPFFGNFQCNFVKSDIFRELEDLNLEADLDFFDGRKRPKFVSDFAWEKRLFPKKFLPQNMDLDSSQKLVVSRTDHY